MIALKCYSIDLGFAAKIHKFLSSLTILKIFQSKLKYIGKFKSSVTAIDGEFYLRQPLKILAVQFQ